MTESSEAPTVEERALEAFGNWLVSLADDTRSIADSVFDESVSAGVRRPLAGGLNYFFKSLDLIDDGIEGLGYLDDAFVLRIAADQARSQGELSEAVSALADDAPLIREFLGDLAGRLDRFVKSLENGVVRGRSVEAIVDDASVREELVGDVRGWASRYTKPQFVLDDKGLVKLRSFLGAKLPD